MTSRPARPIATARLGLGPPGSRLAPALAGGLPAARRPRTARSAATPTPRRAPDRGPAALGPAPFAGPGPRRRPATPARSRPPPPGPAGPGCRRRRRRPRADPSSRSWSSPRRPRRSRRCPPARADLPDSAFGTRRSTQIQQPRAGPSGDRLAGWFHETFLWGDQPYEYVTLPVDPALEAAPGQPPRAPVLRHVPQHQQASRTSTPPSGPSSASAGSPRQADPSARTRASSSTSSAPSSPGSTPSGSSPPPTTGRASP